MNVATREITLIQARGPATNCSEQLNQTAQSLSRLLPSDITPRIYEEAHHLALDT